MAIAVDDTGVVQVVDNVESAIVRSVRNDGPDSVSLSTDPDVVAAGADAFVLAANAEQQVDLAPGQGVYAICASGKTASVEVI